MIGLANLALLGGLAAAAVPVMVHIAHRRKSRPIRWAAMRFLLEVVAQRKRRLMVEHWLLLAVRVGALLFLALALCRPYWAGGTSEAALERRGAVAAVLLVDDSPSTGAGRGETAFAQARGLADAYLDTLDKGDEISLIRGSQRELAAADPVFSPSAAREELHGIVPTAVASDIPALVEAGLRQLARHVNPSAELVLITDGAADGWHADDVARWEELRRRLAEPAVGRPGVRLVVLAPPRIGGSNLAVEALTVDRSLIPAGRAVTVRVKLVQHQGTAAQPVMLRVAVDGRPVVERPVTVPSDGATEEVVSHTFTTAGSHLIEATIDGARDILPSDDRRALAVEVERGVKVLLVEGESGTGFSGSLGHVAAALVPQGTDGLFAIERISAAAFTREHLESARVVVLGDVPALDQSTVAALESFVVTGGGVLVGVGPRTEPNLANRFWARGGHGFLPASLGAVVDPPRDAVISLAGGSQASLATIAPAGDDPWKGVLVGRVLPPDIVHEGIAVQRLVNLSDGTGLFVERARGHGRVVLCATTLSDLWTDLPRHAVFVPLIRGIVSDLASILLPPRNLRSGEAPTWVPPSGFSATVELTGPDDAVLPARDGTWEGRRAVVGPPSLVPGGYRLKGQGVDVRFAVAIAASESAGTAFPADGLAKVLGDRPVVQLADAAAVAMAFAADRRRPVELWRWLVVLAAGLLVFESWLVLRQADPAAAGVVR